MPKEHWDRIEICMFDVDRVIGKVKAGELDGALEGPATPLADQIALRQGP